MHFNMIYIPNPVSELGDFHENKSFRSCLQIFTSSGKTLTINFGIILFLFYPSAEALLKNGGSRSTRVFQAYVPIEYSQTTKK